MTAGEGAGVSEKWLWRGLAICGLMLIVFPGLDLTVSRQFFRPGEHNPNLTFVMANTMFATWAHDIVQGGSRLLAVWLTAGLAYTVVRARPLLGLGSRQWLFLGLALAVGPGLVANLIFKETWDRARPAQIQQFGGTKHYTPPLVMADQCSHNCSFVSGDAAAAFYLHSFAYVAGRRRRLVFFGGVAAGIGVGLLRIAEGAHFLSDVLYAGAFMVAATAAVYAMLYGRAAAVAWWRTHILSRPVVEPPSPPAGRGAGG